MDRSEREKDPLRDAARSVLDGGKPDWRSLHESHPELSRDLEQLEALETLARAFAAPIVESDEEEPEAEREGAPPEQERRVWGPLHVHEKVGEGGFGEVYRAFDPVLEREVALKLRRLHGEAETAAFEVHLEEARRLARIKHPNVLTVYGAEIHDGRAGIWTDFVEGGTLEDRLQVTGPMDAGAILRAAVDLCRALAAVHGAGLLHGDVKTANAMLGSDGHTILTDFGAGSRRDAAPDREGRGGSPQGTPIAMAPELLRGESPSVATDLYALGALLYRLATGRYPFQASTWTELAEKQRLREMIPVEESRPDLPGDLARAIERLLSPEPADRPESAAQAELMLEVAGDAGPSIAGDRSIQAGAPGRNAHRFPRPGTRFIGRRRDILAVKRLIVERRLVTLTGSGGCGKTRLAVRVAEEIADSMPDGAWWVDLSSILLPGQVAAAVAEAIGLEEDATDTIEGALRERLASSSRLLLLDNCEHLREACADFAEWLVEGCPRVRILATSREPLQAPGEATYRVPSLEIPIEDRGAGTEMGENRGARAGTGSAAAPGATDLGSYESVRLFVDRACRQSPEFVLRADNAGAVARIVRRLDGIPLAIELAAARAGALGVEAIASRLDESFRLLTARREAPPRHQTLRASIAWSVDLLDPEERRLLFALSVFNGGWTLGAAEAVCADAGIDVVDALSGLVEKSLVQFDADAHPEPRYRLLEMVRAFAAEELARSGDEPAWRERHLDHVRAFAKECDFKLFSPEQERYLALLEAEQGNCRAALAWCLSPLREGGSDPEAGLHLCLNLRRFWFTRGHVREGLRHYQEQLERPGPPSVVRARAMGGAAAMYSSIGRLEHARELGLEALEILRRENDVDYIASNLGLLGYVADCLERTDEARSMYREAFALHETRGSLIGMGHVACNLGVLEGHLGNAAGARGHYETSLRLFREAGDEPSAALVMANLGYTAMEEGDLAAARRYAEEGAAILRASANRQNFVMALRILGRIALEQGRLDEADAILLESLEAAQEVGQASSWVDVVEALALLASRRSMPERAARLYAAAEVRREKGKFHLTDHERVERDAILERVRGALGEDRFIAAWAAGRALSQDQATELARTPASRG